MNKDELKKYPKGHFVNKWMGLGLALFSGLGVPISVITENYGFMGIGPAIGIAVGIGIGTAVEKKHEEAGLIRELTPEEKEKQKRFKKTGWLAVGLGLIALLVFLLTYLMD